MRDTNFEVWRTYGWGLSVLAHAIVLLLCMLPPGLDYTDDPSVCSVPVLVKWYPEPAARPALASVIMKTT